VYVAPRAGSPDGVPHSKFADDGGTGMNGRITAAAADLNTALTALAGCSDAGGSTTTEEHSYEIAERIDALVVDARGAAVTIETGDGPVTVTETHRFSVEQPVTAHRVDGSTLRLTDSGCPNDNVHCSVAFRVRVPAATRAEITSQAGTVEVHGLTGNISVSTQAGAVEGRALGGDEVSISTQAGAATLEFVRAPSMVRASTEVGAVEVRLPGGTSYAVDVHTAAGASEVSVQHDPASTHKIDVRTSVGAVKVSTV
jgi:DUF4097 and DUF4098 domain-containing protein YvlB